MRVPRSVASHLRQTKVGGRHRHFQPSADGGTFGNRPRRFGRILRRQIPPDHARGTLPFHHRYVKSGKRAGDLLYLAERPADPKSADIFAVQQPELRDAGPLGQVSAARNDLARHRPTIRSQLDAGSDAIPIAGAAFQPHSKRTTPAPTHVVAEGPQLASVPVLDDQVEIPVGVQIERHEGAAVRVQIESADERDVLERTVSAVPVAQIAFPAAPGAARANQQVDRPPSFGIRLGTDFPLRALRHDLPPEEASKVVQPLASDVAILHEEIEEAVVIKVHEVGRPRPSAGSHSGLRADVDKAVSAVVPEE